MRHIFPIAMSPTTNETESVSRAGPLVGVHFEAFGYSFGPAINDNHINQPDGHDQINFHGRDLHCLESTAMDVPRTSSGSRNCWHSLGCAFLFSFSPLFVFPPWLVTTFCTHYFTQLELGPSPRSGSSLHIEERRNIEHDSLHLSQVLITHWHLPYTPLLLPHTHSIEASACQLQASLHKAAD